MNFGFWTSLVHEDYGDASERKGSLKTIKGVKVDERKPAPLPLWPALREQVFPGAQGIELRVLSGTFNEIRKFRNRVFHHEPIWRKPNTAGAKLIDRWRTLETAANWLGGEWALIGPHFYKPPTVVANPAHALIEVASALRDAVQLYRDSIAEQV